MTENKYDENNSDDETDSLYLQTPYNTAPLKLLKRPSDMNFRLSEKINFQCIHVYSGDKGSIVNEDMWVHCQFLLDKEFE